jgi:hypothetical protein
MLFIDADSLVYKAGWSVETRMYVLPSTGETFGKKVDAVNFLAQEGREDLIETLELQSKTTGDESHARQCLRKLYDSILEPFYGRPFLSFISGSTNFRNSVAKTKPYKGNRLTTAKPYYYDYLRECILKDWNGELVDGIEADDRLAIEASQNDDCILVGIDKDLLQIPGLHYNYDKKHVTVITEQDGWRNFFTQVLTGDTSDNIPGLKGVGPAKANKILGDEYGAGGLYRRCLEVYAAEGALRHDDALSHMEESCELLYLLRYWGDSWGSCREWLTSA